jgi:DNA-binding MarR family transcriptional regulator
MPICQQLMYAGHLLHGRLREKLCPEGIHRGQGRILSILAQRGTLSQTEIAECFHRRGATVTHMIQRLEEQGLVERVPDPSDARARRVSLTPAGREVAGLVQETWDDLERRLAAVLSPEQAVQLAGLLGLVIDDLAAQPAELAEGDD